jgi:hypothetical protein
MPTTRSGSARERRVVSDWRTGRLANSTITRNIAPMPTRKAISGATPKSVTPTRIKRNEAPHKAASTRSWTMFLEFMEGAPRAVESRREEMVPVGFREYFTLE